VYLSNFISSIDIVEFLSQYTELTEKNGEYWGLSPLKEENTPSFSVRKEENTFYDFSSGVGGNVLYAV
jgi:DNA primase